MSHVKIKARPDQPVRFPGVCVHCLGPQAGQMRVRKRIGRVTRVVHVPLCQACAATLEQRSGAEERLYKLARVVALTVFLLGLSMILLLAPAVLSIWLRLLVALSLALLLAAVVFVWLQRAQRGAMLPAKRMIQKAAAIASFSWRATTFDFENEAFAAQFAALNTSRLMETQAQRSGST